MRLFQIETKSGNEVEVDVCCGLDRWAIPLFVSWWRCRTKLVNDRVVDAFDVDVHLLCFSLHVTLWRWDDETREEHVAKEKSNDDE